MVSAVTATCDGRTFTSMVSRSMTTDVSSTPRSTRWSATWFDALIGDKVEVPSELFAVNRWSCLEELGDGFRCNESEAAQRGQLADRHAIAGHDEGLALVKATHDLSAAIPQFSLGDDLTHPTIVARRATPARKLHPDDALRWLVD